ncbi:MAG TPA: hypothetical protein VHY08_04170, partial [Bacillota bacterium]|nr:hypothetical protein [Bacillota bacterium]
MKYASIGKIRLGLLMLLLGLVFMILGTVTFVGASSKTQAAVLDINQAQWLIVGPFSNPPAEDAWKTCQGFEQDYLSASGGEAKARFKKGQKIADRNVISAVAKDGIIDLLSLYPNRVNTVAYAYLEIASSREQKVALKLGSDDGIKVWLNGDLVWTIHSHRSLSPDQEAVAANLKRGVNRLLVKVDQGTGNWGFSARIRSFADEAADWAKEKNPAYQVLLPQPLITEKGQAWCIVSTIPALVIPEPVNLLIYDGEGNELANREGVIGEPISLQLPEAYKGIIGIQAVGVAKQAAVKSRMAWAIVGDYGEVTEKAIAEARKISKEKAYDPQSEDLGATLSFLADQLEGKLHPSLANPERNLRAIGSIYEIKRVLQQGPWQTATLRGTRQWAYHSVIDDSCQPYTVYIPDTYDSQKKYSLILTLHGYTVDDFLAARKLGDLRPEDFIIVGAFGRGDMGYHSFGEQDVLDVLARIQQIYSIDPDRVYLMGESMGGMGTWRIGQFYADRFAALAPFCGWTGTDYLENLRNLPILIVHGDADPNVPYLMDGAAASQLNKLGYDYRFDLLPGGDHDAWGAWAKTQGGGDRLFEYFRKYRRNPWPVEVNLRVNYLRYGRQYWVWIKELARPLAPGTIHALVKGPREIQVETNGVKSLTLDLRHLKLEQTGEIKINIDNQSLTVSAGQARAQFNNESGQGWRAGLEASAALASHLGGGLVDLLHGPVIFVYGTQKPERSLILKRAAETIADFGITPEVQVGSKVGYFQVKADTE